jgi:hypothetical protein
VALSGDEVVEHEVDLLKRQLEAGVLEVRARIREAQGAIEVAGLVDFDDAEASVLLMVGAQAAIERATVFDFGGKLQGKRAGLVVRLDARVQLGIAKGEGFGDPVFWATFAEVNFVVAQKHLRVNYPLAGGAEAFGELPKDFGAVGFLARREGHEGGLVS